jgi:hypothetical protein
VETGKGRQQFPFLKRQGGERAIDTLRFLKYLMKGYDFTTRRFEIRKKLQISFKLLCFSGQSLQFYSFSLNYEACETNHFNSLTLK